MQEMAELDHLRQMGGINRNLTKQAIDLKIRIREEEVGHKLNDDQKQELINEQLKRPQSQAAVRRLNQRMGLEGQAQQAPPPEEDESSSVSSDWDDWQDPDYIEEQRQALQDFGKKQREIKATHSKKKKKKKPKKKRGADGGINLDMDNEPSEYYTVNDNQSLQSYDQSSMQNGTYEEEKIERSNNTVG